MVTIENKMKTWEDQDYLKRVNERSIIKKTNRHQAYAPKYRN